MKVLDEDQWRQEQHGFRWDIDNFRLVVDNRHQVWSIGNFSLNYGDDDMIRQVVNKNWEWA